MKKDLKETAVANIPKAELACLNRNGDGLGYTEFIIKQLSAQLAERIMGILEREEEIIVRQSDLRVSEFIPTDSVEYRRQIKWSPLVRCNDCKHYWKNRKNDEPDDNCAVCLASPKDDAFCSEGERREDDAEENI